ncbi:MAG: hypothetical protein M1822_009298 [Bathelium mastoideum]|nr:MAG: hypothetical protein M1822_009298 [Bathelium mastoideum]
MRAFPKLPEDQVPHCGYQPPNLSYVPCSEEEYLKGAASASPMFPNAHTTVYSNEAFSIIAFALSKVTGMDFETLFNRTLVAALDLSGTFYTVPTGREYQGAIPGDPTETGWNSNLGPSGPNGGYFSTVNDMATIGKAILNSTLLPPAQTRRWLKPTSFVAYENQAVGRPWEIYRRSTNGHTVDIYSKGGNWGQYATAFLLIPEYDFGFTVLTAADFNTTALSQLQNSLPASLTDTLLPVLEQIAQEQAVKRFAGTYASSNGSSSITFGVDNFPALKVTEWKSLGLNMTEILQEVGGWSTFDFRLYPNHLNTGNSVGFTSLYYTQAAPSNSSTWYLGDPGWFIVDQDTYGNIPVGQFVFQTDKNGIATAVELRSTRQTLRRV